MKIDNNESKVTYYDLGQLGTVAKFNIKDTESKGAKWGDIVVLDASGSMGGTVKTIVTKALPDICQSLGISLDQTIHLVAFETKVHQQVIKVKDLPKSNLKAMDCTYMADAVVAVSNILTASPDVPFRILVISDGAIADSAQVLKLAAHLPIELANANRSAPISVCQIQAITSKYAQPDTQALTCFGQLDSMGTVAIHSVQGEMVAQEMPKLVTETFGSTTGKILNITSPTATMMRFPGSQPLTSLMTLDREPFLLFLPGTDMKSLSVNGEVILESNIIKGDRPSEDDLLPLLLFVESQIKQLMVLGNDSKAKEIMDWIKALAENLRSEFTDQLNASGNPASTMFRRRNIVAKACNLETTVMERIKQLSNLEKVSTLNSQRQAEFLKGVGSGSMGRSLAKRAAKVDNEDMDQVIPSEAKALREFLLKNPLKELRTELTSFYSHDTISGVMNGLSELKESQISQLTPAEIMQFVGPIGLSFRSKISDAPDPWSCIQIERVFAGDSYLLISSDLWNSRTAGGGGKLLAPGTTEEINGVLPVRSVNPEAYDAMIKYAPNLFKVQVAASLRGSMVSMPGDYAALTASCAIKLAEQLAATYVEATANSLQWLISDLRNLAQKKVNDLGIRYEHLKIINEGDPRTVLAGDVFIASETKPLAGLLAGSVDSTPKLARATLGYICYIASNRKVKEPEDRKLAIKKVLGIRMENFIGPGEPFTFDPVVTFYNRVDYKRLKEAGGTVPLKLLTCVFAAAEAYDNTRENTKGFGVEFQRIMKEEGDIIPRYFGMTTVDECKDLAGACVLQGLLYHDLTSRIEVNEEAGTRTFKLNELDSPESIKEFVELEVLSFYEEMYKEALKNKRNLEKELFSERLVAELIVSTNLKEFIQKLNSTVPGDNSLVFKDRSDKHFQLLLKSLFSLAKTELGLQKLWVLILGRDLELEPVFLLGNVMRGLHLAPFQKLFVGLGFGEMWDRVADTIKKFGIHSYREVGANRHGHSNQFPSWWALGFNSLNDYQVARPEEARIYIETKLSGGKLWANPKYQNIQPKP